MSIISTKRHSSQNLSHITFGNKTSKEKLRERNASLRTAQSKINSAMRETDTQKAVILAGDALAKCKQFIRSNTANS